MDLRQTQIEDLRTARRKAGRSLLFASIFLMASQFLTVVTVADGGGAGLIARMGVLVIAAAWFFWSWAERAKLSRNLATVTGQDHVGRFRKWHHMACAVVFVIVPLSFGAAAAAQSSKDPAASELLRDAAAANCTGAPTQLGVYHDADQVVAVRGATAVHGDRIVRLLSTDDPRFEAFTEMVVDGSESRVSQVLCIAHADGLGQPRDCEDHRVELVDAASGESLGSAVVGPVFAKCWKVEPEDVRFELVGEAPSEVIAAIGRVYPLETG